MLVNEIVKSRKLSQNQYEIWVANQRIADHGKPGQFIILRVDELGERIPLTIVDTDRENGTFCLIYQTIGKTTTELADLQQGDCIRDVLGPLGEATKLKKYGTVMLVGGGVGIAALYPIIKGLKQAGNRVITVLGARTKELVILEKDCYQYSDECITMTDDGSSGRKGLVTEAMEDVFKRETVDACWSIGPSVMMKFCTQVAEKYHVPIYVSLNPIMIDGTGMCGGCRVTIAGEVKFACVEGPEFLGTEVNWTEFIQRMAQYKEEEAMSLLAYEETQVKNNG